MSFKYDSKDIWQGGTGNHGLDERCWLRSIVPEQVHQNGYFENAHRFPHHIHETSSNRNQYVGEERVPFDGKYRLVLADELLSAVKHEWAVNI